MKKFDSLELKLGERLQESIDLEDILVPVFYKYLSNIFISQTTSSNKIVKSILNSLNQAINKIDADNEDDIDDETYHHDVKAFRENIKNNMIHYINSFAQNKTI